VRSLPLVVKVVFLAVLIAALLPFVLGGTVASAFALAFVAMIVVIGVVATVAEPVIAGRAASRQAEGWSGRRRGLIAVAVTAGLLAIPVVAVFRGDSEHTDRTPAVNQRAVEQTQQQLQGCSERSLSAKACVRRLLGDGRVHNRTE
jgi:hypothetical protein